MSKLPQDLITEILSRVPVKPLIRFKCVCKTWISLISNPEFAKLQLKRAKENNNVSNHYRLLLATWPPQSLDYEAYCNDDISNALRKLSYHAIAKDPNDNYDVRILGSCDGLVYLCNEYHDSMFLWNPTIGDYKELPKPNGAFHGMYLYGIGYNVNNDDYEVLFASRYNSNNSEETIVELYTLKTRTWRQIEDIDLAPKSHVASISWNGAIYWLVTKESGLNKAYVLVSFDMTEEKFKEILTLPDSFYSDDISAVSLGTSGNSLCVFFEKSGSFFEALILDVNNVEAPWSRLFCFPHDTFGGYGNSALCITNNGEILMDSDGYQIFLYNPKERVFKYFRLGKDTDSESGLYAESLISPNI
ncbi:F-box/kelch-repeat protein At3g06240 isoform X1 [Ricinus communis]|uniref:F-box/kelch-repeat protein At3g06240 isoform X1 n=1 Tax=Ricinus communis TaxID=3988 RepID=UPI00201A801B|nr:F-box/kelch-repeat protein At3g06240 isoform X1 [Ricinus communis]